MRLKLINAIIILLMIIPPLVSAAQRDEDVFFYGDKIDEDMKSLLPDNSFSMKGIQYGAILSPVIIYEENDEGKLGTYILNAKVWAKMYLWRNSFFYIRGKESFLGKPFSGEGIYAEIESDNVVDLDLAYLSMSTPAGAFNLSVGRKFYTIGTGLVLNGRGDGGEMSFYQSFFSIDVLGLYTGLLNKDNNPYGLSDKDINDGAKRIFGGGTISASYENQKLYLFGLVQVDKSEQETGSETKYDSQYYGVGLDGVLFENLAYYAEFIYETGKSYNNNDFTQSNIAAYALNSGINYYFNVKMNPALLFQYTYATGDKNRSDYSGSNRNGGDGNDTGFISFGTYSGGYALKAKPGNLHIIKTGTSFAPLSNLSIGAKYLVYIKDKKEAPINDGTDAGIDEPFAGQGVDLNMRWRVYNDLSLYVNYGLFLPGKAYDSSTGEMNFIMAGVNLSI